MSSQQRRLWRTALLFGVVLAGARDDNADATGELRVGSAAAPASVRLLLLDSDHPLQDVFVRSTAFGVEDFAVIDRREDDRGFLEYVLTLNAWTKGLRLVERSLELLDKDGAPRIRMQAPYLIDRQRKRSIRDIDVTLDGGCNVDRSPVPPFARPIVPPGRNRCTVRLSWTKHLDELAYPILVDPGWMTTGALATPRYRHTSTKLANGDVLVAGGLVPDPVATEVSTATAEIYSVTNGAWATTASMNYPRALAAAAPLANDSAVLVAGGFDQTIEGQTILGSAEIYSAATGTWSKTTGDLIWPRAGHSVALLDDSTVLVAAGFDNDSNHFPTTELFTPATGTFSLAGNLNTARFDHAAMPLPNGRGMILSGGSGPMTTGQLSTIELYIRGSGWSAPQNLPPMMVARALHSMVGLPNGDVLIVGGYNRTDRELASAEIYHPTSNTITSHPNGLVKARYDHVGVALVDGRALFIGGQTRRTHFADGELFDPVTSTFLRVRGMATERAYGHQSTVLEDGRRVLVSGGFDPHANMATASTDMFDLDRDAGGPYLPDDEERDAGASRPPSGDAGVVVWPPVGDGRPGRADASAPPTNRPQPADSEAAQPNDTPTTLRGGGSGCAVGGHRSETVLSMMTMIGFALFLFGSRRHSRWRDLSGV